MGRGFNMGRASASAAANKFERVMNGIGQSKLADKRSSGRKAQRSGQMKSDRIHSRSSLKGFRSVAGRYFSYVKEEYGTLRGHVNTQTASDFLRHSVESGQIKGSSANTYISHMQNIAIAQERMSMRNTIDTKEIAGDLRDAGIVLEKVWRDRAYDDPSAILDKMQGTDYGLSTQLQVEHGLRAADAIDSSRWRVTESGRLEVHGSKGGITYQTSPLSPTLLGRVQQAIQTNYRVSYTTYTVTLRENTDGPWYGSHGLRYNFAQHRVLELQAHGLTYKESLAQTSLEMGHSRASITEHYLPR